MMPVSRPDEGRRRSPQNRDRPTLLVVKCYCCGEERDPDMVAALQRHDDIKVCRICIGWLITRAGGVDVTPKLPVTNMAVAVDFYEAAGFDVDRYDDGFAFVHLNDQSVIIGCPPPALRDSAPIWAPTLGLCGAPPGIRTQRWACLLVPLGARKC